MCGEHSGCESTCATSGQELCRVAFGVRILRHLPLNLPGWISCSVTGCSFSAIPSPFRENQRLLSKHFAVLTLIFTTTLLERHYHSQFVHKGMKLSNLPKIMQLASGRARIQSQNAWFQHLCIIHLPTRLAHFQKWKVTLLITIPGQQM